MNILMLCDNYTPEMNANARIFSELASLWSAEKEQVTVITSHPNFPSGKIFSGYKNTWRKKNIVDGVQVVRVKTYLYANTAVIRRTLDFLSFGFASFIAGLFEKDPHVIVGVTPQFFCGLSACLLAKIRKKPFVLVLCDLWPDSIVANKVISKGFIYALLKKLELFMYRQARKIVILSPNYKAYLNELSIDDRKIMLSISGANQHFSPRIKNKALLEYYQLQNKFVVGYIGTFGLSHNHEDILIAASWLKQHYPQVQFLMVGDGAKKKMLTDCKEEHQLDNVLFDGPFPAEQIPDYWSLCDVAIVPLAPTETNKTVIPSKILEAMAMGLPVILYAPESEAARFFSAPSVWHIETGQVDALKKLIAALAQKNDLSSSAMASIEFAKQFTREKQAQQLLSCFYSTSM